MSIRPDCPHRRPAVLVVEDEPAVLNISRFALERAGYEVLAAVDGPDGVARFRAAPDRVAAVVLDVNLPGLSGWQVLAELRRLRPGVRVVMTSGWGCDELESSETGEMPTAVLPKPYRPAELAELVAAILAAD